MKVPQWEWASHFISLILSVNGPRKQLSYSSVLRTGALIKYAKQDINFIGNSDSVPRMDY